MTTAIIERKAAYLLCQFWDEEIARLRADRSKLDVLQPDVDMNHRELRHAKALVDAKIRYATDRKTTCVLRDDEVNALVGLYESIVRYSRHTVQMPVYRKKNIDGVLVQVQRFKYYEGGLGKRERQPMYENVEIVRAYAGDKYKHYLAFYDGRWMVLDTVDILDDDGMFRLYAPTEIPTDIPGDMLNRLTKCLPKPKSSFNPNSERDRRALDLLYDVVDDLRNEYRTAWFVRRGFLPDRPRTVDEFTSAMRKVYDVTEPEVDEDVQWVEEVVDDAPLPEADERPSSDTVGITPEQEKVARERVLKWLSDARRARRDAAGRERRAPRTPKPEQLSI